MKKLKYCLLALLCPALSFAQPALKPLAIGDRVPDVALHRLMNDTGKHTRLSDMKGRLLILDFWASYCTACLLGFGELQELQQQFGKDLQVLLVNTASSRDDERQVSSTFERVKKRNGRPIPFPTLVKDTVFDQLFPHASLPHCVWIVDGRVAVITNADELTATNIANVMKGQYAGVGIKKEQDAERPLFSGADLPQQNMLQYSILTKGKFAGLGSGNRLRRSGKIVFGRAITNSTLYYIYRVTGQELIKDFSDKRMLITVRDTALLKPPADKALHRQWLLANLYSYDLILPLSKAGQLYRYMLDDLNRSSGFLGTIENRDTAVWVLSATRALQHEPPVAGPMMNRLTDSEYPCMRNCPVPVLMLWLDHFSFLPEPLVDETGIAHGINICLPAGINTVEKLQAGLEACGLSLTRQQRTIPMLVIRQPPK